MNLHLDFLLSNIYDGASLDPDHRADLNESGITDATLRLQRLRSVPPTMIPQLLAFDIPAIRSALLIPFPHPAGGFMDHVRLKVFPSFINWRGQRVKYLQPRHSGVRLFFALAQMEEALHGTAPLWVVEGEKKCLAVAQLGLPTIGFCGIEGWHLAGSTDLLLDFEYVRLSGRTVELLPDGDCRTNINVRRGALRFVEALEARGARVRIVMLPTEVSA